MGIVEAVLTSTHNLYLSRNMTNIRVFLSETFQFLEVEFSGYLNRCVFVMRSNVLTYVCFEQVCPIFNENFNPIPVSRSTLTF